jgi:hypothetical protein
MNLIQAFFLLAASLHAAGAATPLRGSSATKASAEDSTTRNAVHLSSQQRPVVVTSVDIRRKLMGSMMSSSSSSSGDSSPPEDGAACTICTKEFKNKPTSITVKYVSAGKNSLYQGSNKASCREGIYPSSTNVQ